MNHDTPIQAIQSKWHERHRQLWLAIADGLELAQQHGGRILVSDQKFDAFEMMATDEELANPQERHRCYACMACAYECVNCPLQWSSDTGDDFKGIPCLRSGAEYLAAKTAEDARSIAYMPWDASKETEPYPEPRS